MEMMQSIQNLMSVLKENPDNYNLIIDAGDAYFEIGRFQQSIRYYKKAKAIQPTASVLIDLGVCYFNLGKLDSARVTMEEALRWDPDYKKGLYNIGIVFYNLGDTNSALENWQHLITEYPNTPEAESVKQYINELKNIQTDS